MNLFDEPDDHAIGRSHGGLSTKIHALVDGKGRPLVLVVAPGQGGDAPMFTHLMNQLEIIRHGPSRPRARPDRVRGDKGVLIQGDSEPPARPRHHGRHSATRGPNRSS